MTRVPAWEENLLKTVELYKTRPFQWGKNDCCFFSAACVEAITGENPLTRFKPDYSSKFQAFRFLKESANGPLFKTLENLFGKAVSTAKLGRGDLVYREGPEGPTVGVCLGRFSAFVGEENKHRGLVFLPTLLQKQGFKIL